eukprot:Selendium_serpulae@DN8010_c0_g1_i1.p1
MLAAEWFLATTTKVLDFFCDSLVLFALLSVRTLGCLVNVLFVEPFLAADHVLMDVTGSLFDVPRVSRRPPIYSSIVWVSSLGHSMWKSGINSTIPGSGSSNIFAFWKVRPPDVSQIRVSPAADGLPDNENHVSSQPGPITLRIAPAQSSSKMSLAGPANLHSGFKWLLQMVKLQMTTFGSSCVVAVKARSEIVKTSSDCYRRITASLLKIDIAFNRFLTTVAN